MSRVCLADDVQVSVMSLAGLPSNDLAVLASLLYRTLDLHASSLLHQPVSERSRDGCRRGAGKKRPGAASRKSPQGIARGQ